MAATSPSISAEIVAAVRALEVRARRAVREGLGGRWRSSVRGAGLEFAEVREYVVGDDARTLDWNVTARTGRLQVKRFDEEREQTLFFLIDVSRSTEATKLACVQRSWRAAAAEAIALLGFAAAEAGDRVGALLVSDRIEEVIPPRHGVTALLSLLARVLAWSPRRRATDLDQVLRAFLGLSTRPCLAFLVSDFHELPRGVTLAAMARRHDLVALSLRAPLLLELRGLVRCEDPESGATYEVDLSDGVVRRELEARIERDRTELMARFGRAGAEVVELATDRSTLPALIAWSRRRALEVPA